jgi:acetyltransferase
MGGHNPHSNVVAAHIDVEPTRCAIRAYPCELEEELDHRGRRLVLRPIRPEDAPEHRRFLSLISPEDLRLRFFVGVRQLPEAELAHFTHIDYEHEMAFVAVGRGAVGDDEIFGVVRACADPGDRSAEFAVLVRSDLKQQGLGRVLMEKLIRYCRMRGMSELWGSVLTQNVPMMHLARSLGFKVRGIDGNVEELVLELQPVASHTTGSVTLTQDGDELRKVEMPDGR